jgi:putative ABC transport system permease protein
LLPALQAWRGDLSAAREAQSVAGGARQTRARNLLVMTQIALSLPLLTAGVLLTRTFTTIASVDPGFNPNGAVSLHLAIPRSKYRNDDQIAQVIRRFIDRVAAVPGVTSAGGVNRLPLSGTISQGFIEFDAPDQSEMPAVDWRTATPDYFKAIGIPLVEGRSFDGRDTAASPRVGIVDQRVARTIWPNESAIGKRFRIPARLNRNVPGQWVEIVGVVGAIRHDALDVDPRPQIYWPSDQWPQDRIVLVVRGDGQVASLAPSVISALHEIDPEQPVYDVRTMDEVVERSLSQRWLNAALVTAFAASALGLCAIGVYGVIAFGVTRQRREFGIRMALGASRRGIATSVVGRGLKLAVAGLGLGLILAVALTRAMASMLYGVSATDGISFTIAVVAVFAIAATASYLPARRAAMVDPADTLRAE